MRPPYSDGLIKLTEDIDNVVSRFKGQDFSDWTVIEEIQSKFDLLLQGCACRPLINTFDRAFRRLYRENNNIDQSFNASIDVTLSRYINQPYWRQKARISYEPDLRYVCAASVYAWLANDQHSIWAESLELFNHANITYKPTVDKIINFQDIIYRRRQIKKEPDTLGFR